MEDAALLCLRQYQDYIPLTIALCCEETDMEMAKHLTFIFLDSDDPVEGTLIGHVYLDALQAKARLQ
jgi:hypothetical protein